MGSVISKKKGPEPKPKITEQDKEILVSGSGFHFRKVDLHTSKYDNSNIIIFTKGKSINAEKNKNVVLTTTLVFCGVKFPHSPVLL